MKSVGSIVTSLILGSAVLAPVGVPSAGASSPTTEVDQRAAASSWAGSVIPHPHANAMVQTAAVERNPRVIWVGGITVRAEQDYDGMHAWVSRRRGGDWRTVSVDGLSGRQRGLTSMATEHRRVWMTSGCRLAVVGHGTATVVEDPVLRGRSACMAAVIQAGDEVLGVARLGGGDRVVLARVAGLRWRTVRGSRLPQVLHSSELRTAGASPQRIWASAGLRTVWRWNGQRWDRTVVSRRAYVTDLAVTRRSGPVAVGERGTASRVWRWSGSERGWTAVRLPPRSRLTRHSGVRLTSVNLTRHHLWVAGSRRLGPVDPETLQFPTRPVIWRRAHAKWISVPLSPGVLTEPQLLSDIFLQLLDDVPTAVGTYVSSQEACLGCTPVVFEPADR